jgi:hypothetical protein
MLVAGEFADVLDARETVTAGIVMNLVDEIHQVEVIVGNDGTVVFEGGEGFELGVVADLARLVFAAAAAVDGERIVAGIAGLGADVVLHGIAHAWGSGLCAHPGHHVFQAVRYRPSRARVEVRVGREEGDRHAGNLDERPRDHVVFVFGSPYDVVAEGVGTYTGGGGISKSRPVDVVLVGR